MDFLLPQIPEEEKSLGPHDRMIHVYHFLKDTAQNQMVRLNGFAVYTFFLFSAQNTSKIKFLFNQSTFVTTSKTFKCYVLVVLWEYQHVQNFGDPFFLVIREGETLADVKLRVQKKLQVPNEEFLKVNIANVIELSAPI